MTGIASNKLDDLDVTEAANVVKEENKRVAELIGVNPAARCTTVKPAGTTSLALGTSSGIHAWHNDYYMRRLRVGKNEAIYKYLVDNHPELVQDEYFRPHDTAVIEIPQSAPKGSILRDESPFDLLERIKKVAQEWIVPGHRKGSNTHNVSATVSLKQEEWDAAGKWMWENREHYNGLSVLPYDGGTYTQAPFEDISKVNYDMAMAHLKNVDLTRISETEDETKRVNNAAEYAAAWVHEVNIKNQLGIKFWEIGNENWGKWQAGYNVKERGIIDPKKYGEHCRVFIEKMKAVDPTIKIGVVGFQKPKTNNAVQKKWNELVIPEIIDVADFYILHDYYAKYGAILQPKEMLAAIDTTYSHIKVVNQIIEKYTPSAQRVPPKTAPGVFFQIIRTEFCCSFVFENNTIHISQNMHYTIFPRTII